MRVTSTLLALALLACDGGSGTKPSSSGAASARSAPASAAPPAPPSATATAAAAEPAPPPSDVPTAAASANLTMNDATLDGLTLRAISCHAPGANPFTAIGLFAPLAKQRAALDACVEKPTDVRVTLDVKAKKAAEPRVAGAPDGKAATCVAKAIAAAEWGADMSCVATLALRAAPKN